MSHFAVRVENVSKRYRLGARRSAADWLRRRVLRASAPPAEDFWALRDVGFELAPGDVLGVLGKNGAGKSTLLKIISRITPPTAGRVAVRGRVASLLEVGTAFHPELTGRDNIFLNGSILGMKRAEIRARFDEIVAFAGVERFLDTPVKRYSSGMFVRLAFAVAAHLEPEILVIDEVLAVGDGEFQRKCLGKMQSIAGSGRTVLFVSHNLAAVNAFCTRAIYLRDGGLAADGAVSDIVARYVREHFSEQRERCFQPDPRRPIQITRLAIEPVATGGQAGIPRTSDLRISAEFDVREPIPGAQLCVILERPDGTPVLHTRNVDDASAAAPFLAGRHRAQLVIPGSLLNAESFTLRAVIDRFGGWEPLDEPEGISFELQDPDGASVARTSGRRRPGVLCLDVPWTIEARADATQYAGAVASAGAASTLH